MPSANPLGYLGPNDASETTQGIVRLATATETVTPDVNQHKLAVTPYGLAQVVLAGGTLANTLTPGLIQLATNGEAAAKVAANRGLTASNIPSFMSAPGPIGNVTKSTGTFTTLTADTIVFGSALDVAEGGTGLTSITDHGIMLGSGTGAVTPMAVGTNNQVIIGQSAADPIWSNNLDLPGTLDVTGVATFDDNVVITGTLTQTGLVTFNGSIDVKTAGTTLGLGSDNDTAAVNLGIGSSARVITIGGTGGNTIAIGTGQTTGSVAVGTAMTTGTITIGGATNTGILTLGASTAAGGQTVNIASAINTGIQVVNIAAGDSGATSTVNILSGNGTAGTLTLNLGTGNRAKAINIGNGIDGNTIAIGNGVNTTAQTINIANGASAAATTVNIMSGTGTASTGTLAIGNNPRVITIGLGNIAPSASRTTTIAGGTVIAAATTDTLNLGTGGATTNADSVKTVNVNTGGVTLGQVLTNIATGAVTSGTHTTAIATGNRAAGTMAVNILTGTGTKTMTVGNADGATTSTFLGPHNINVSQNNNTAINTGTSTGTISIGNALSGAITIAGGAAVDIDAVGILSLNSSAAAINIGNDAVAQAINLGTGGAARTITLGNTTGATAVVVNSGSGAVTCNTNFILGAVATQFQMNGGAVTDFIGQAVLVAGTKTVANTNIAAADRIFLSRSTLGGTPGHLSFVINPAADFVITSSSALDTSTIDYVIIRQN